jgi:hypothetical protein
LASKVLAPAVTIVVAAREVDNATNIARGFYLKCSKSFEGRAMRLQMEKNNGRCERQKRDHKHTHA